MSHCATFKHMQAITNSNAVELEIRKSYFITCPSKIDLEQPKGGLEENMTFSAQDYLSLLKRQRGLGNVRAHITFLTHPVIFLLEEN